MLFIGTAVAIRIRSTASTITFAIAGVLVLVRICAGYLSIFSSTLDTLVAVLVQTGKISPETSVICRHDFQVWHIRKPNGQIAESCCMEFILMRLFHSH